MVRADRPAGAVETHSATVFFLGDHAYKVKKPVDLGFLDFRRREAREAACHREVALNRRLAPDVYEGVADVRGPDGELCDHLVVMRRMPTDRRLSTLVRGGAPVEEHLRHIAHQIATLHAGSPRSPTADEAAGREATHRRWSENTDALIAHAGAIFDETVVALVHGLAARYLDGRAPLFEQRVRQGAGVDGHGDLLADDIFCLPDGPRILDCMDFDDQLRLGDGLADVAFLAMDLDHLGRPDLARQFLDAYGADRGDAWPPSLAHHQMAYRAQVRAKVRAIRADQGDREAATDARELLDLALAHLEAGRVRLVLVGGLPGTGKSTVAAAISDALPATLLRSDEIRKEGTEAGAASVGPVPYGEGRYTPTAVDEIYRVMLDRAEIALSLGETVVLDASWSSSRWRDDARALADRTHADLVELRCTLPEGLAEQRLQNRAAAALDPSDATPEIARIMAAHTDPWPEAHVVPTAGAVGATVEAAMVWVRHESPHGKRSTSGTRHSSTVPEVSPAES